MFVRQCQKVTQGRLAAFYTDGIAFLISDAGTIYCTFEEATFCPLSNNYDATELWTLVDGNGQVKDNTLNIGMTAFVLW
jgi:hypothetical protein